MGALCAGAVALSLAGGATGAAPRVGSPVDAAVPVDVGGAEIAPSRPGNDNLEAGVGRGRHQREMMAVGNNWDGTATIIDVKTLKPVKTLNIIPDRREELLEIYAAPDKLAFYLAIQQGIGEGHDQYVDDLFTTRDGKLLVVSRPSFADVVWIDMATGRIVAEQQMNGYRTDHMNVSPNRRRVLVSDSTDRSVHEYVMGGRALRRTGKLTRSFESGDTPHESNYLDDGARIIHASIGRVYTPFDYPELGPIDVDAVSDAVKADRWLQIVDNDSFEVLRRWDIGEELAEAGHPGMSSAVRPMAISPDEKTIYLQVSFFHGIVEFALDEKDPTGGGDYEVGTESEPATGRVVSLIPLPISDEAAALPREQYVLDSAHHGIDINHRGNRLCVAGTMSDYAAVVTRKTGEARTFAGASKRFPDRTYAKPYWVTTSEADGNCWISMAGTDLVLVIDYRTRKLVKEIPVGFHPQRVRDAKIARKVRAAWAAGKASSTPDLSPVPIPAQQLLAAQEWVAEQIAALD
jgi:hypothetical protein